MIKLEVTIESNVINEAVMEEIRDRMRKDFLAFVFKHVDGVAEDRGYRFSHKDVFVEGNIKVE
jgi:hypothetical protein